jgi:hypothetical protein
MPQICSNITSSREGTPHYHQNKFSPNRKSLNATDEGSSAERNKMS